MSNSIILSDEQQQAVNAHIDRLIQEWGYVPFIALDEEKQGLAYPQLTNRIARRLRLDADLKGKALLDQVEQEMVTGEYLKTDEPAKVTVSRSFHDDHGETVITVSGFASSGDVLDVQIAAIALNEQCIASYRVLLVKETRQPGRAPGGTQPTEATPAERYPITKVEKATTKSGKACWKVYGGKYQKYGVVLYDDCQAWAKMDKAEMLQVQGAPEVVKGGWFTVGALGGFTKVTDFEFQS